MTTIDFRHDDFRALTDRRTALAADIERFATELEQISERSGDAMTAGEEQRWNNVYKAAESRRDELRSVNRQISELLEEGRNSGTIRDISAADRGFYQINKPGTDEIFHRAARDGAEAADLAKRALEQTLETRAAIAGDKGEPHNLAPIIDADPRYAEIMRARANPDYYSAWCKLAAAGDSARGMMQWTDAERHAMSTLSTLEQRAMSVTTDTSGGFGVPVIIDPQIMLSNAGTENEIRRVARKVTGVSDTWKGITSDGVDASWDGEAAEASDDSPTLTQPSIAAHKAQAWVPFSIELESDWQSLGEELMHTLADAKDRLEATAFVSGDGSDKPYGLVTRLEQTTSGTYVETVGTAGEIAAADIYDVFSLLAPRWRRGRNVRWMSSLSVANAVRAVSDDKLGNYVTDLAAGYDFSVLGRPWHLTSDMDEFTTSTGNETFAVVGDFNQYVIYDRQGSGRAELVPHVFGGNQRPTGQRGIYYWWRVGGDVYTADDPDNVDPGFRRLKNSAS